MFRRGPFGFQRMLREVGRKTEFLLYWTMSQMLLVAFGVLGMMGVNFVKGGFHRYEKAVSYYELLWTFIPTFLLCTVAGPRMALLYLHEEEGETRLNVKVTGHQWYWRYEYGDVFSLSFDRLIVPTGDLERGESRLLEADARMVVPIKTQIQLFVTREDVIHSWALPSRGIKIDATPGRLNSVGLFLPAAGVFYGQCSELCGANHRLMPITVEVTTPSLFVRWFEGKVQPFMF